ncbi:MAG: YceG family protein [Ruminococcus sp.]|nr:YceG family protein [Ruminococcus sp.]
MFQKVKISSLDDYFISLSHRNGNNVFFYRINIYNDTIKDFICRYYNEARKNGVIIDGNIPNPDMNNLSYYSEIMGETFSMNRQFFAISLKKWLPTMNDSQCGNMSRAVYDTLSGLASQGKNENILKNAYIKFMCWLYYRFRSIADRLGADNVPKILYNGSVNMYELMLFSILSKSGCDVVLLQTNGDSGYIRVDPVSAQSFAYTEAGKAFPPDFSLKYIQNEIADRMQSERLLGQKPSLNILTNTWARSDGLADAKIPPSQRGGRTDAICNIFYRMTGVDDKASYINELISFRSDIKSQQRKLVIVDGEISPPTYDELSEIRRGNYNSPHSAVAELVKNISFVYDNGLQTLMRYEFAEFMLEKAKETDMNINKFVNMCVYVLAWLKRWQMPLFAGWKKGNIACFVLFGCCRNESDSAFVSLLSRLPSDVILINSNPRKPCILSDKNLREFNYDSSLEIKAFPKEGATLRAGTVAYHAERELDEIMYQDTGLYRNHQYSKATSIVLDTMFEEIELMWNQELKYRPNFSTENGEVIIPVFFSKISGVKDGNVKAYWQYVKRLITEDTVIINGFKKKPVNPRSPVHEKPNPIAPYAQQFIKNGILQKSAIKSHSCYQYGILRGEIQDYILEKLQILIDSRIIKGTFENGMEYAIISSVLNMDKEIVRRIQNFDFTKKNPKILYINTGDSAITQHDAIVLEFLSISGFDVLFVIPTGYCNVENYYNMPIISEHQMGGYIYDLKIPDFSHISGGSKQPWHKKLFRRGV